MSYSTDLTDAQWQAVEPIFKEIESGKTNNYLTRTQIGDNFNRIENYTHDAHGYMISMPHLSAMNWDSEDRLHEINLGGGR